MISFGTHQHISRAIIVKMISEKINESMHEIIKVTTLPKCSSTFLVTFFLLFFHQLILIYNVIHRSIYRTHNTRRHPMPHAYDLIYIQTFPCPSLVRLPQTPSHEKNTRKNIQPHCDHHCCFFCSSIAPVVFCRPFLILRVFWSEMRKIKKRKNKIRFADQMGLN